MRLAEFSQHNPAAVAAAAAIVLLFGVLALLRLPIQLLPDTRQPELFVNASWREAAPAELEEALIEPIEEAMRGLPGLVEMRSEANRGAGRRAAHLRSRHRHDARHARRGLAPEHVAAAAARRGRAAGVRRRQLADRERRLSAGPAGRGALDSGHRGQLPAIDGGGRRAAPGARARRIARQSRGRASAARSAWSSTRIASPRSASRRNASRKR